MSPIRLLVLIASTALNLGLTITLGVLRYTGAMRFDNIILFFALGSFLTGMTCVLICLRDHRFMAQQLLDEVDQKEFEERQPLLEDHQC